MPSTTDKGMQPSQKDIDDARAYLLDVKGLTAKGEGVFKRRQEVRLRNRLVRRWKVQRDWLLDAVKGLSAFQEKPKGVTVIERKAQDDEVESLVDDMPEDAAIAEDVVATSKTSYSRGARYQYAKLGLAKIGISFDIVNGDAADYLSKLRTIHLSKYRGSISGETKKRIIRMIKDSVLNGDTYDEVAKKIRDQGEAGVFSKARGELIAVNQVGNAYGEGNNRMVKRAMDETGKKVKKSWLTTGDDRVTPECQAYEDKGWIDFDANFTNEFGTSDQRAPRKTNPRCRCDTVYEFKDDTEV